VALHAQRLPVGQVVALAACRDRHHVIGVGLTSIVAHPSAPAASPRVTRQHSLTPRPVGLVAVAPGGGIGTVGVVPPGANAWRSVCWYAGWHQLLNMTVAAAVTPVAAATSLM